MTPTFTSDRKPSARGVLAAVTQFRARATAGLAILAGVILGTPQPATGQAKYAFPVAIRAQQIWCDKTTEAGEDEVYLLVGGITTKDGKVSSRIPNNGHQSVNDNFSGDRDADFDVWSGELQPGESVELTIVVMEEDDGKPAEMANLAGKIADGTLPKDGLVGAIGSVLSALMQALTNTDDVIAVIGVRLTNTGGMITEEYVARERATYAGKDSRGLPTFNASGDGSRYNIHLGMLFGAGRKVA